LKHVWCRIDSWADEPDRWIADALRYKSKKPLPVFADADDAPGWKLMETTADGKETGRDVGGLHESLLEFEEARVTAAE